jgi:MFS superfamily sulfate permease-like transporter
MVGAVRIALSLMRCGSLMSLVPPSVLDGFTLGAVWLVFATQAIPLPPFILAIPSAQRPMQG